LLSKQKEILNMAENYNQQSDERAGMGVVLGIILAVVIAIGAYFFMQNRDGSSDLEPAAGMDTPLAGDTAAPDTGTAPPATQQ
jgi:hypothetical protein